MVCRRVLERRFSSKRGREAGASNRGRAAGAEKTFLFADLAMSSPLSLSSVARNLNFCVRRRVAGILRRIVSRASAF